MLAVGAAIMIGIGAIMAARAEMETKYAGSLPPSTSTNAVVVFGPRDGRQVVKTIYGRTDKQYGLLKLFARPTTSSKFAPATVPAISATVIHIADNVGALTNGDRVVYAHANGVADQRILSAVSGTNVTLDSGISIAGAAGDYLYEVSLQGVYMAGTSGTTYGTDAALSLAGDLFATPGDSPFLAILESTSNNCLTVTIDRP